MDFNCQECFQNSVIDFQEKNKRHLPNASGKKRLRKTFESHQILWIKNITTFVSNYLA